MTKNTKNHVDTHLYMELCSNAPMYKLNGTGYKYVNKYPRGNYSIEGTVLLILLPGGLIMTSGHLAIKNQSSLVSNEVGSAL